MRLVWDMRKPWESTWAFPIGESGHVLSPHFKDMVADWKANKRLAVFDDGFDWRFVGRSR